MIRFLRKLRYNLVSENKFKRYIIYAMGEIILVVIGILIALQINSWNDYRKDRRTEQLIFKNFRNNLETDRQLLDQFHEGAKQGVKAVDTILLMINGHRAFDFMSFSNNLEKVLSNIYFQSTSTTFDQAISTGKIDLILEEEIRAQLLDYYKLTKLNFEDNRMLETNQNYVVPTLLSQIIPTNSIALAMTGIETQLPELDLAALASNQEFNSWVLFKRIGFERQAENYKSLKSQVENMIQSIDQQIDMAEE